MKPCAACPHPRAVHQLPDGGCRYNGCPCDGYRDAEGAQKPDGQVVFFQIPDGYSFTVSLVPVKAPGND